MLTTLSQFDPLSFLNIDTSTYTPQEKEELQTELFKQIGQYILLSFSDQIPAVILQTLSLEPDGGKILTQLRELIADFDTQMLAYVEQFKNEYQTRAQNSNTV